MSPRTDHETESRQRRPCTSQPAAAPYDRPVEEFAQPSARRTRPVPHGPRYYRLQLRRLGAPFAVVALLAVGLLSVVARFHNESTVRGLLGFLLAVLAFPLLLVVGAPLTASGSATFFAIVGSLVVWGVFGLVAAKRATASPVASWRDFWHEFVWLAASVWAGVIVALVAANLVLGRAFL